MKEKKVFFLVFRLLVCCIRQSFVHFFEFLQQKILIRFWVVGNWNGGILLYQYRKGLEITPLGHMTDGYLTNNKKLYKCII